jgi:hypothetical protein
VAAAIPATGWAGFLAAVAPPLLAFPGGRLAAGEGGGAAFAFLAFPAVLRAVGEAAVREAVFPDF